MTNTANAYTITKATDTGLMEVRYNGRIVGRTQTPAGAALIRRNDRRRNNR